MRDCQKVMEHAREKMLKKTLNDCGHFISTFGIKHTQLGSRVFLPPMGVYVSIHCAFQTMDLFLNFLSSYFVQGPNFLVCFYFAFARIS